MPPGDRGRQIQPHRGKGEKEVRGRGKQILRLSTLSLEKTTKRERGGRLFHGRGGRGPRSVYLTSAIACGEWGGGEERKGRGSTKSVAERKKKRPDMRAPYLLERDSLLPAGKGEGGREKKGGRNRRRKSNSEGKGRDRLSPISNSLIFSLAGKRRRRKKEGGNPEMFL